MLALLIASPSLAAAVIVLVGHRNQLAVQVLGVGSVAVSWLLAMGVAAAHWGQTSLTSYVGPSVDTGGISITLALGVDALTVSLLLLATTVAVLVQVYSVAFLTKDPRYPSYAALIALFTSAMTLVVAADDLFVLLVGWEVMGACSYLLIAHHWEREPARAGAAKAFVMTRLGDVGLLFGIFVAGRAAGTYRISGLLDAVASGRVDSGQATAACLLFLCGVVGKSAQFPLHSWLPDAMPGPTPVSALIHAATMVAAGVYLVARLLPLFERSEIAMDTLATVAIISMLGGAAIAFATDDLKRVLAWSTVSQLAYMFGALALGGFGAGVLQLLAHGAFKALLFLAAGSVIGASGRQRLDQLGALRRALPLTFVTMTVGLAALAGVPPFAGFFAKDAVLGLAARQAAAGSVRAWLILLAAVLTAVLTAAYATRLWLVVFFGAPAHAADDVATPHEPPALMTGPLVVLAAVTTFGGVAVLRPSFLGVSAEPFSAVALALGLSAVAIGAIATYVGWRRLDRRDPAALLGQWRARLADGLGFDQVVTWPVVQLVSRLSQAAAASERDVVAPYVRGADSGAQWAARGLRWLHGGNATSYLTGVVVGAVGVAVLVGVVQR